MKHEMEKLGHDLQVRKLDQKHEETLQVCIFIISCFWQRIYDFIKAMKLGLEAKKEEKKKKEEKEEKENRNGSNNSFKMLSKIF